jgi:hypothetical protein
LLTHTHHVSVGYIGIATEMGSLFISVSIQQGASCFFRIKNKREKGFQSLQFPCFSYCIRTSVQRRVATINSLARTYKCESFSTLPRPSGGAQHARSATCPQNISPRLLCCVSIYPIYPTCWSLFRLMIIHNARSRR